MTPSTSQPTITLCTPRLVRLRLGGAGKGLSYLPAHAWQDAPPAAPPVEPQTIPLGRLALQVGGNPLALALLDGQGAPLLRLTPGGSLRLQPAGDAGETGRLRLQLSIVGDQHFYGLGLGGASLDRYGTMRRLWTSHYWHGPGSDIPIPLLLSSRGYGLFFDNSSDAYLHVGGSGRANLLEYGVSDGAVDIYIMDGGDLRGLLGEAAELLGRALLPPRWALGFIQSTRHFTDTAEVESLPRTLREKRIPCDALVFLSAYSDALGWNRGVGHLEWQPELWPQPQQTIAALREQGFQVVLHEYPVLHEHSPLFAEAQAAGYLLDDGYARITPASRPSTNFQEGQRFIDWSNPAARTWWWQQHAALYDQGVAGWWLDGGEGPAEGTRLQAGEGTALHSCYDLLRQRAFAEGQAAQRPAERPWLLCRSGGAGMQRFGAACWSGDINNTFATLEEQVAQGVQLGLSGIPYWGTDIGGFFHPIAETGELYARWFQFGAFCPVFRSHGWVWREHTPWAHGAQVEDICRRYSELRYRLLPYTYTLAWQAHAQGLPLMRPLVLNYPDDARVWNMAGEYLWGDDLLVAPVTRQGATHWPVYLPAGGWYDFWTHQRYDGPLGVTVEAPLERLPLFVRAGAIIPLGPVMQHSAERPLDEVTLLIYPEGRSHFTLYEDDGCSPAYRQGSYAQTAITCEAAGDVVTITIGAARGEASLIPAQRRYTLQVKCPLPRRVSLAGVGDLAPVAAGGAGLVARRRLPLCAPAAGRGRGAGGGSGRRCWRLKPRLHVCAEVVTASAVRRNCARFRRRSDAGIPAPALARRLGTGLRRCDE